MFEIALGIRFAVEFRRSSDLPLVAMWGPSILGTTVMTGRAPSIAMQGPTEFFNWYITDERTGKRRLTTYKLSRADAERAFPGAEPDLKTREVRNLPGASVKPPNSRPGGEWS
jgi:hypothetical protein